VALRCDSVLVRLDGVFAVPDRFRRVVLVAVDGFEEGEERGVVGVDGGDDGDVVLEFVEVVFCCGDSVVERVLEGGVVWAEGELGDTVGEVECCNVLLAITQSPCLRYDCLPE
jgi:hypothetical protein